MMLSRIKILAGLVGLSTLALTACGGGSAGDQASSSSSSSIPRVTQSSSSSSSTTTSRGPASSAVDGGISEVKKTTPPVGNPRSDDDKAYLKEISSEKINLKDNKTAEDQLIAAGNTVCLASQEDQDFGVVTANALAGQLVAQKLTKLKPEEVSKIIISSAKKNYCK